MLAIFDKSRPHNTLAQLAGKSQWPCPLFMRTNLLASLLVLRPTAAIGSDLEDPGRYSALWIYETAKERI